MSDLDAEAGYPVAGGLSHEASHERLPEYATSAALGRVPETVYPDIADHLARCAECRERLDELLALSAAAYAGDIAPSPPYPAPNLDFLPPDERTRERSWWIDEAQRVVIDCSQALLGALRPLSLAGAARGGALYRYEQEPGTLPDLELAIEVFAEGETRQSGWVRVSIDVPSCDPLAQPPMAISLQATDLARAGTTDEAGIADFAAVPLTALSSLRVTVSR